MPPLAAARPSVSRDVSFAPLASVATARIVPQPDGPDPVRDAALVAYLVEHHHAYVRRVLPYILALLAKMAGFFGRKYERMNSLCDAGEQLAEALEAYIDDEEREVFPALLASDPPCEALQRALGRMLRHHLEVGKLLGSVRFLTDDYEAPIWAGRSYEVLLEELEALEENVMEHRHLASYVLVPRISSWVRRPR